MLDVYGARLLDLLPRLLRGDASAQGVCYALQAELDEIISGMERVLVYPRVGALSGAMLDELAADLHVDFYAPGAPLQVKRALVRGALALHREKGTPAAVGRLASDVFGASWAEEWFEYGGAPYRFRVVATNPEATEARAYEFIRMLESVKNARSVLDGVVLAVSEQADVYCGAAVYDFGTDTIVQETEAL